MEALTNQVNLDISNQTFCTENREKSDLGTEFGRWGATHPFVIPFSSIENVYKSTRELKMIET